MLNAHTAAEPPGSALSAGAARPQQECGVARQPSPSVSEQLPPFPSPPRLPGAQGLEDGKVKKTFRGADERIRQPPPGWNIYFSKMNRTSWFLRVVHGMENIMQKRRPVHACQGHRLSFLTSVPRGQGRREKRSRQRRPTGERVGAGRGSRVSIPRLAGAIQQLVLFLKSVHSGGWKGAYLLFVSLELVVLQRGENERKSSHCPQTTVPLLHCLRGIGAPMQSGGPGTDPEGLPDPSSAHGRGSPDLGAVPNPGPRRRSPSSGKALRTGPQQVRTAGGLALPTPAFSTPGLRPTGPTGGLPATPHLPLSLTCFLLS